MSVKQFESEYFEKFINSLQTPLLTGKELINLGIKCTYLRVGVVSERLPVKDNPSFLPAFVLLDPGKENTTGHLYMICSAWTISISHDPYQKVCFNLVWQDWSFEIGYDYQVWLYTVGNVCFILLYGVFCIALLFFDREFLYSTAQRSSYSLGFACLGYPPLEPLDRCIYAQQ